MLKEKLIRTRGVLSDHVEQAKNLCIVSTLGLLGTIYAGTAVEDLNSGNITTSAVRAAISTILFYGAVEYQVDRKMTK